MNLEQQEVAQQVQQTANPPDAAKASAGFTSLGRCLQQARSQAGFTVQQIANEMHLEVKQIELIEQDRFRELGVPVFVKGYLRRYARLVNVDEAMMQGLYDSLRDPPVSVDPIPTSMNSIPVSRRLLPAWSIWAAAGMFALVSIGTVFNKLTALTEVQETANVTSADLTASPLQQQSDGRRPKFTAVQSTSDAATSKSVLLAAVTPVATANAGEVSDDSSDVSPAPAPGHVALTLKFSGDSWTEVYDANKRAIMYEMGHDATTRQISGLAPLSVVLGSVPQVALQINGRNAVIPANRVSASVARFAVDSDGTIH